MGEKRDSAAAVSAKQHLMLWIHFNGLLLCLCVCSKLSKAL